MPVGIEHHVMDKVETPIFDPAKTIVDCFCYRNKVGMDIALDALGLEKCPVIPSVL